MRFTIIVIVIFLGLTSRSTALSDRGVLECYADTVVLYNVIREMRDDGYNIKVEDVDAIWKLTRDYFGYVRDGRQTTWDKSLVDRVIDDKIDQFEAGLTYRGSLEASKRRLEGRVFECFEIMRKK